MTPQPHFVPRIEQAPRAVRSAPTRLDPVAPTALIALCDTLGLILLILGIGLLGHLPGVSL